MARLKQWLLVSSALVMLTACDGLPDWVGGPDKEPLPGERIAVLMSGSELKADESMADVPVTAPAAVKIDEWAQDGGIASGQAVANIAYGGNFSEKDSIRIGEGNSWKNGIMMPPVIVAAGMAVGIDAKGYVSAASTSNLRKTWEYEGLVEEDEPDVMGGGVAYDGGVIFAASGRGKVAALSATDGKELWKVSVNNALRSAPRVENGNVYVLTVDNQLYALDETTGATQWNHRGINEGAGYLSLVTPAAVRGGVIAPYSSGEIKALKADSGDEAWSDSLALPRRTSAASIFSGIDANPVIVSGVAYAISNGGLLAANDMASGRRLWEQDISSMNAIWVGDDFLYVLTSEAQLVCLSARDGRIKWVKQLARFEDESSKKNPLSWSGPVMIDGKLIVTGAHGYMFSFAPETGEEKGHYDIPDGVYVPPIVVGDALYLLDASATLHMLK